MPTIGTCGPAATRRAARIGGRFAATLMNAVLTHASSIPPRLPQGSMSLAPMSIVTSATDPRCSRRKVTASASCERPWYWSRHVLSLPRSMATGRLGERAPQLLELELGVRAPQDLVELVGVAVLGRAVDAAGRLDPGRQRVPQRQVPDRAAALGPRVGRRGQGDEAGQDEQHAHRRSSPSASHRISSAWVVEGHAPAGVSEGTPVVQAREPPCGDVVSGRGFASPGARCRPW